MIGWIMYETVLQMMTLIFFGLTIMLIWQWRRTGESLLFKHCCHYFVTPLTRPFKVSIQIRFMFWHLISQFMLWPNKFSGNGDSTKSNPDNLKHHEQTPAAQKCYKSETLKNESVFLVKTIHFRKLYLMIYAPILLDHSGTQCFAFRLVSIVMYKIN